MPSVRKVHSPKNALNELFQASARSGEPTHIIFDAIAREVRMERCANCQHTGFEDFVNEIRKELGPLV